MGKLRLWLISQDENDGYDTYDSAVVAAADQQAAKHIHPSGYLWRDDAWRYGNDSPSKGRQAEQYFSTWTTPNNVQAKCVGIAAPDISDGDVICASFNAG